MAVAWKDTRLPQPGYCIRCEPTRKCGIPQKCLHIVVRLLLRSKILKELCDGKAHVCDNGWTGEPDSRPIKSDASANPHPCGQRCRRDLWPSGLS
jgi:hypothetical protein